METALVPILSVLLGAGIAAGASFLVESVRSRNLRRVTLLEARREVELDALDEVHRTIETFRKIWVHNHTVDDEAADLAQAEALSGHLLQLDDLELLANRVHVLANPSVGLLVQHVRDAIVNYFMSLNPEEQGAMFRGAEIDAVEKRLNELFAELKTAIRADLHTSDLDG